MTKPILVAGATGGVGRQVVQKLLAEGQPVRVLARDYEAARAAFSDNVEYIAGEAQEPETLAHAVAGVEAVICAMGARGDDPTGTPQTVDYEGVRNLVQAAKSAGNPHFVLVSRLGASHPDHPSNQAFDNLLLWKSKGEDALRASGLPYTIIRPGALIDEPGGERALRLNQGDANEFSGSISREDVAELCVQALKQPALRNVTFEVVAGDGAPGGDWDTLFAGLRKDNA